jgi:hypothetical protein
MAMMVDGINKRKVLADMSESEKLSMMMDVIETNKQAMDNMNASVVRQETNLKVSSEKFDVEFHVMKDTVTKALDDIQDLKARLGLIEVKSREDLHPPPAPPPILERSQSVRTISIPPKAADPPVYDIMMQGLPAHTLNTDIEEILNKIANMYDGLRPPEVRQPAWRDQKGFLRFPDYVSRKVFLQKLKDDPPNGIKVGDHTPNLSFKNSQAKEFRDRTKEVRWWGWAAARSHIFGDKAKDRKLLDTDLNKLLVLMCNAPVGHFVDSSGTPIKGPLDRSKHTFKVEKETIKTCFARLGITADVEELVKEFDKAMAE